MFFQTNPFKRTAEARKSALVRQSGGGAVRDGVSGDGNPDWFVSMYGQKEQTEDDGGDDDEDVVRGQEDAGDGRVGERSNSLRTPQRRGTETLATENARASEGQGLTGSGNVESRERQSGSDVDSDGKLKIAYNFLNFKKANELRDIAKDFSVKQNQKKELFIANFIVWLRDRREEGADVLEHLKKKPRWGFDAFMKEREIKKNEHRETPNWKEILSVGDPYRKKREDTGGDGEKTATLTLSEFARMMVQIRDDGDSREAVLNSRRPSSRAQLDAKIRTVNCWEDVIARKFNDSSYHPVLDLSSAFRNVDSSSLPEDIKVGKDLMDAFNSSKKNFGVWYKRWYRSGQRDPDDFGDFGNGETNNTAGDNSDAETAGVPTSVEEEKVKVLLEKNSEGFRRFIPKSSSAKILEEGNRALVIFICLRCGTPHEDGELLALFHRGMGAGKGSIHFESGLPYQDQENNERSAGSSERKRKRRRTAKRRSSKGDRNSANSDSEDGLEKTLQKLATNQVKIIETQSSLQNSNPANAKSSSSHLTGVDETFWRSEQMQKILRLMAETEDMLSKNSEGSRLHILATKQLQSLEGKFNNLCKEDSSAEAARK